MGTHSAVRLAAPLISAGAFLAVTAAWLYDVYFFSPALNHPLWEYLFVAAPYVVVGVFGVINYLARANLVFSIYGFVGALFIAAAGLLLWYGNFFGSGNDLGFGIGLFYQLGTAVAITGTGWIAILLYKAWQWFTPRPTAGTPAGETDLGSS